MSAQGTCQKILDECLSASVLLPYLEFLDADGRITHDESQFRTRVEELLEEFCNRFSEGIPPFEVSLENRFVRNLHG